MYKLIDYQLQNMTKVARNDRVVRPPQPSAQAVLTTIVTSGSFWWAGQLSIRPKLLGPAIYYRQDSCAGTRPPNCLFSKTVSITCVRGRPNGLTQSQPASSRERSRTRSHAAIKAQDVECATTEIQPTISTKATNEKRRARPAPEPTGCSDNC